VEVVVQPHRIEAQALGLLGHVAHRLVLCGRVLDMDQVHAPALRDEDAKLGFVSHCTCSSHGCWGNLGNQVSARSIPTRGAERKGPRPCGATPLAPRGAWSGQAPLLGKPSVKGGRVTAWHCIVTGCEFCNCL
jgi:hypothetical protein